jgi:hypothetical protein
MRPIDRQFWKGRRVFVTGHMGFKGAWLCALLGRMGAETIGFGRFWKRAMNGVLVPRMVVSLAE